MVQSDIIEAGILDAQIWDDEPKTATLISNHVSVTNSAHPAADGVVATASSYGRRVFAPFLEGDTSMDTSIHSDMDAFIDDINHLKNIIEGLRTQLGEEIGEILIHDTRGVMTPLVTLMLPLRNALKSAPDERMSKMLVRFKYGVEGLVFVRDAIRSILHYQMADALPPETVPVKDFFAERINGLQKESLKVELVMHTDLEVSINTGTLGNLIQNMRNNAVKHGKATEMRIEVYESEDGMVEIAILDNGSGIDNTDGITVRGESHGGSTGFGLADTESRLATFGATIEIDGHGGLPNKNGTQGACFKIKLQSAYSNSNEFEAQIA